MKLTAALILFTCLHVSAGTYSQDRVSLKLQSAELKKVLAAIEKKTDYRFLYSDALISNKPKVDVNVTNEQVTTVLDQVLSGSGIGYRVLDNKLVVLRAAEAGQSINIPDVRVTGKVTGAAGDALPGVSVTIKGTQTGVTTDAGGNYAITVPDDNSILVFSYVGFESQELPVNGRTTLNVTMQTSNRTMDQVVVIGYGTASKRDLTGSIVKVPGKEVADKPNTNPVASLQGKVAGMSIVNSGQPGQEPDIRIRGTISRYQTKPLYVIDGLFNDNMNFVNPADIESIEILKDPSSLAIFGVRGANGVIIVTTKKGRMGLQVNFNASYGVKKIVDNVDLTNASEFKTLFDEQRMNQGAAPFSYYDRYTGNTDWIDLITNKSSNIATANLSLNSGTEKNKFYMGVGYLSEEGLINYEKLEKIILNMSDELRVSKAFKVGFTMNGYRARLPLLHGFLAAGAATPIVEPFNTTHNVFNKLPDEIGGPQIGNPLMGVEGTKNTLISTEYRAIGSVYAEVSFLKNFSFRTNFYADLGFNNARRYTPNIWVYAADLNTVTKMAGFDNTRVNVTDNTYSKFQQEYLLNFKKTFGDHNLTAVGGFTTYYNAFEQNTGEVTQYKGGDSIPNNKRWWYINVFPYGDPASKVAGSDQWEQTTVSYLVRALYSYKQKYLFNASFRRDGSSEISSDNRFQNFYAFGAGWEISREDFMNSQNIFDYLKLKASYGVLGNQYVGQHYPFYPALTPGATAVFGNNLVPAYTPAYLPDPNLKWETVTSVEAGVEAVVLKNRLRFELVYFNKMTNDLLTTFPAVLGTQPGITNAGKIQNKGIEASATWSDRLNNGLGYVISGNITTLNNEVKNIYKEGFEIIEGSSRTAAGQPIGYFYGYVHDGIYQSYADKLGSPAAGSLGEYGPGDIRFKDVNGDGVLNEADRTIIGNPTPDFIYGLSLSLDFKGFDFGVDMQGVYGNEIFREWGNGNTFAPFNYRRDRLERWHGEGTSNWEPQVNDTRSINRLASTYMIEDGSYFRIRNVSLGYNFASAKLDKWHIKNLRLFVNGQNLKTFKRNSGFTPEFGGSATRFGVDDGSYPIPAVYSIGLNATF